MASKAHGSAAQPVQASLRWGVDPELAEHICCFNRQGAESSLYFTTCKEFTKELGWQREPRGESTDKRPIVFYDSVSGDPCFVAPLGRTVDDFLGEALRHGWPSFRQQEVCWDHVRVLEDLEVVTTGGTHLGHQMSDANGPRFCINLCSVAGLPDAVAISATGDADAAMASDEMTRGEASVEAEGVAQAWPVLHQLAAAGMWRGSMSYASGSDGMSPAPFVLDGEMNVDVATDGACTITSSVVLPNGVERRVMMQGQLSDEVGATVHLCGNGPIDLLMSEHPAAHTLLTREVNATTGETLVSSSLVLIDAGGDADSAPLLIQTAHELTRPGHEVGGVQMWRMTPQQQQEGTDDHGDASVSGGEGEGEGKASTARGGGPVVHDTEAFMYSGSEL